MAAKVYLIVRINPEDSPDPSAETILGWIQPEASTLRRKMDELKDANELVGANYRFVYRELKEL